MKSKETVTKPRRTVLKQKFADAMASPDTKSHTEAAKKAGYSSKSAHQSAYLNMNKCDVLAEIDERKRSVAEFHRITPEFVTGGIVNLALTSESDQVKLGAFKILGTFLGLEKNPDENPGSIDRERSNRENAERVLAKIIERQPGITREEAIKQYIEAVPEARQWLD